MLLDSLKDAPGFDRAAFLAAHEPGERQVAVRLNPEKRPGSDPPATLAVASGVPWCPEGYYLKERPSFFLDPLWHAGAYYVQEPSSMIIGQVLRQLAPAGALRILDLCAAPGGKSTLVAANMAQGSLLVSNEVIASRVGVLEENLVKWGTAGVVVTRGDAKDFGGLTDFFDLILVDAPCSGSGLFRKDSLAAGAWSADLVTLSSRRQQRILADVMGALKPGGILVYSTCSYSVEENEDIADFLCSSFQLASAPLQVDPRWGIWESLSRTHGAAGYRFYPYRLAGEGFYLAAFRKPEVSGKAARSSRRTGRPRQLALPTRRERESLAAWLADPGQAAVFGWKDMLMLGVPQTPQTLEALSGSVDIVSAGIRAGKVAGGALVPDHGLAMSSAVSGAVPRLEVSREDAVHYLRKDPFMLPDGPKGWALISYRGLALGWVKQLGTRFNNYYPTSWRIRKREG